MYDEGQAAISSSSRQMSASRGKDEHPGLIDRLLEVRIPDSCGDDEIDTPPEQRFQGFVQAKVCVSVSTLGERPEFNEEVKITRLWAVIAGCRRAEQIQASNVVRPTQAFERVLVGGYGGMHEIVSHATRYSRCGRRRDKDAHEAARTSAGLDQ